MGTKSKKGGGFEREMCKLLSLWWSHNKRDDIFWRTAGSGGRATVRRKQGLRTADSAADMMASHESGKPLTNACLFEMKRGYSDKHKIVKNKKTKKLSVKKVSYGLGILTILDKQPKQKDPILLQWWEKLEEERISTGRKFSFIIFRRDAKQGCIVMSYKTLKLLTKRNHHFEEIMLSIHFPRPERIYPLVILKLDDFLKWCEPESFIGLPRQIKRRK